MSQRPASSAHTAFLMVSLIIVLALIGTIAATADANSRKSNKGPESLVGSLVAYQQPAAKAEVAAAGACLKRCQEKIGNWLMTWTSNKTTNWRGNKQEAGRHFVWNVILMKRENMATVKAITGLHEFGRSQGPNTKQDSKRDSWNNTTTQYYFKKWARSTLRGGNKKNQVRADFRRARSKFNSLWATTYWPPKFACLYGGKAQRCKARESDGIVKASK